MLYLDAGCTALPSLQESAKERFKFVLVVRSFAPVGVEMVGCHAVEVVSVHIAVSAAQRRAQKSIGKTWFASNSTA